MTNSETFFETDEHPTGAAGGHSYRTISTHSTSEGRVAYRQCSCGLWRIERYPASGQRHLEAVVDQSTRTVTRHRNPGTLDNGMSLVSSSASSASANAR